MVVYRCLSFRMAICGCIVSWANLATLVFKPLTLLLLLLLAWQAPMFDAISYLVLAGLCASLLGDALTLLPRQRLMYAIGAFFLSHLLYTIYFASQMTLSFFWLYHWCCWFWVRCYWRLSGRAGRVR